MKNYTLEERASFYNKEFPKYPPLSASNGWLWGTWIIGNDYRNKSKFFGAYPASYLRRIMSLFPDAEKVLHLCSGSLPQGNYVRFDIRNDDIVKPDVQGDAHELSKHFPEKSFDAVFVDFPYTKIDAQRYGTPMVNRKKVMEEVAKVLEPGGYVVLLDCVMPMYRRRDFKWVGAVGLWRSTNHRIRGVTIFQRTNTPWSPSVRKKRDVVP